jgi:hypothetical protein
VGNLKRGSLLHHIPGKTASTFSSSAIKTS